VPQPDPKGSDERAKIGVNFKGDPPTLSGFSTNLWFSEKLPMSKKPRTTKLVAEPVVDPNALVPSGGERCEVSSPTVLPGEPSLSKRFVMCAGSRAVIPRRLAVGRFKTPRSICSILQTLDSFASWLGQRGFKQRDAEIEGVGPVNLRAKGNVGVLYDVSYGDNDGWDFGGGILESSNAVAVTLREDMTDEALALALRLPLVKNVMPRLADISANGPRGADLWLFEPGFRWHVVNRRRRSS
jgi:hypothetical protein